MVPDGRILFQLTRFLYSFHQKYLLYINPLNIFHHTVNWIGILFFKYYFPVCSMLIGRFFRYNTKTEKSLFSSVKFRRKKEECVLPIQSAFKRKRYNKGKRQKTNCLSSFFFLFLGGGGGIRYTPFFIINK